MTDTEMTFRPVQAFEATKNTDTATMIANLHANMAQGLPVFRMAQACVIGGGPSLNKYADEIRAAQKRGDTIFCMNGSAQWAIDHDIYPNVHVFYDARPENAAFITALPAGLYMVASHASPEVLRQLEGRTVELIHAHAAEELLDEVRKHYAGQQVVGGAITVGLLMLNILLVKGFRKARLYGYDSSNASDDHHAYPQPLNDGRELKTFRFRDKEYLADPAMAMQAREFMDRLPGYERLGLQIEVIGDGLLPDMWRHHKAAPATVTLEDKEAAKYTAIWKHPAYRRYSPGEEHVGWFVQNCGIEPGMGIIDFGCGTGRASRALQRHGCVVLGLDHAANCLDADVLIPFCKANLWELPAHPPADWGYCCDVMEHIPPEKVDDVLAGIAARSKTGAFFAISFTADNFGKLVGEPLHLTIQPLEWWLEALGKYFPSVRAVGANEHGSAFVCLKQISEGDAA
jgi:SAM-dependent methyltransferase